MTGAAGEMPKQNAAPERERYDAYVGQIARGAGMSSLGQGIGRVVSYATQVALARFYGAAQLGFYLLGVTVVQLALALSQFGMDHSVVRYVARYRAEGDASRTRGTILLALGVPLALSVAMSALMFFGAGLLADLFDKPFLVSTFRAFSLSVPFFVTMSMTLWATQGFGTVKHATYVEQVMRPLINLALIVVFYLFGQEILGAVAAYGISMAVGTVLALRYLKRLFPELLDRSTRAKYEARELFGVSGQMLVATTTGYFNSWAMIGIVGFFVSASDVAVFNAAFRTAALCSLALFAFSGIFSPMISSLYRRGDLDHLGFLYKDVSRWTFTGSLAIFLLTVFLGREILSVFGEGFAAGWAAMMVMAAGQLFSSSTGLTGRLLIMTGNQMVVVVAKVISAGTSVVGGVALIPSYGVMGAAAAMAIGQVLANLVTLFFVKRRLGYWPYTLEYLKPVTAGLLATGAALFVGWFLPLSDGLPTMLVLAPIFGVAFAALILALRLSESDRRFLGSFWEAVRRSAGKKGGA